MLTIVENNSDVLSKVGNNLTTSFTTHFLANANMSVYKNTPDIRIPYIGPDVIIINGDDSNLGRGDQFHVEENQSLMQEQMCAVFESFVFQRVAHLSRKRISSCN